MFFTSANVRTNLYCIYVKIKTQDIPVDGTN